MKIDVAAVLEDAKQQAATIVPDRELSDLELAGLMAQAQAMATEAQTGESTPANMTKMLVSIAICVAVAKSAT